MMIIKNKPLAVLAMALILSLIFSSFVMSDTYAKSKTKGQNIKSYKKSIKTYNIKTKKIAKKTPAAAKYAKKTKGYYKKSKKTNSARKLKSLKKKAKRAYKSALILDYKRQIKEIYIDTENVAKQAPSIKPYVSDALTIYEKAKKCKSVLTLKEYLNKIKAINKNARIAKSKLTWHDAEYQQEYIKGHYETYVIQKAEYELMNVYYYVQLARYKGYVTGFTYDWNFELCKANGAVFPYSDNNEDMKAWGCIAYTDSDDIQHRIIANSEMTDFELNILTPLGLGGQSRETSEWFKIKDEITGQKWVEPHYKTTLIRDAGWY